jgi:spore photoproduct lyase
MRFEEGFYKMRKTIFTKDSDLPQFLEGMEPMFPPKMFPGYKRAKSGKYSFTEEERAKIFGFVVEEIRKFSDCPIALSKESASVWNRVGLPLSECSCACQLNPVDIATRTVEHNAPSVRALKIFDIAEVTTTKTLQFRHAVLGPR